MQNSVNLFTDIEQKHTSENNQGHNSVVNLRKLMCNNSNLELINVYYCITSSAIHLRKLTKFYRFVHKVLSGKEILTITKGHERVVNLRKLMRNNSNLDLVNVCYFIKSSVVRY